MKKLLFIASLLVMAMAASGQTTGYLRYDTVQIVKQGGNAELVLLNSSRNVVGGVLTNLGNGRTGFIIPSGGGGGNGRTYYAGAGLEKINDSTFAITAGFRDTVNTAYEFTKKGVPFNEGSIFLGNSITVGYAPEGMVTPWPALVGSALGITPNNLGTSSTGSRWAVYRAHMNSGVNLNGALGAMIGFNDMRPSSAADSAIRIGTILSGSRALAAYQFTKTIQFYRQGASVVNSNITTSTAARPAVGIDSLNDLGSRVGWFRTNDAANNSAANIWLNGSVVANETVTINQVKGGTIAVATWATDGTINNWSRIRVTVDGVIKATYDPNGRTYGTNGAGFFTIEGVQNDAIIIGNLQDTAHTVILTFLDGGKKSAWDYVAGLKSIPEATSAPMYMLDLPHMNATGYTASFTTQAMLDSATSRRRRELSQLLPGYPIINVETNRYFDPNDPTQESTDGIHPISLGQRNIARAVIENINGAYQNRLNLVNVTSPLGVMAPFGVYVGDATNKYVGMERTRFFWNDPTFSTANNKFWDAYAYANTLTFRAVNDANTLEGEFMKVYRSNHNITNILFPSVVSIGALSSGDKLHVQGGTIRFTDLATGAGLQMVTTEGVGRLGRQAIPQENLNVSSGYRLVMPSSQYIKTIYAGYGVKIDSTTNANALTFFLDSTVVFPNIRSTIPTSGGGGGSGAPAHDSASVAEIIAGTVNNKFVAPLQLKTSPYVDQNGLKNYALLTGSGTTFAGLLTPALTAYVTGQQFKVRFPSAASTGATVNFNSLGAIPLVTGSSTTVASGVITANTDYIIEYNGTQFQILSWYTDASKAPTSAPTFINKTTVASFATAFSAKTAAYTLSTTTDHTITADATTAAFNVTLPTAVGNTGVEFVVKRLNQGANKVTMVTTSSQTIDGASTYIFYWGGDAVKFKSNGANWITSEASISDQSVFTGTVTAVANVDATSNFQIFATRTGRVVHCDFTIDIDPTLGTGTATTVRFPTPWASTFTGTGQAFGHCFGNASGGQITAVSSNNVVQLDFNPMTGVNGTVKGSFAYTIQ